LNLKKTLKILLPILIAGGLLFFVLEGVDFSKTLDSFKNANYFWVFVAALIAFVSHWLRAVRWRLMLVPMGYNVGIGNATAAVLIGYLTNLAFPRAGELARAVSLQNSESVPFEKSFGAVIAERVIDLLMLLLLVFFNIALEYKRLESLIQEWLGGAIPVKKLVLLATVAVVLVVSFIMVFINYREKILKISIFNKIYQFISGLGEGLMSIFKIKNASLFFVYTFLIWVMYYLSTLFLAKAVPDGSGLSMIALLTILVMGAIGMAIPTQGGIGSYHLLVGKIVVLYGLSQQDGFNLATFLHTMQGIIFVLIFGAFAFLYTFLSTKKG
jgi:uncharacterized protein (TIRG00374 family)